MWDVLSADDDDAAGGKGADADEVGACGRGIEIERGVFILLGGEEAADGVVECDVVAGCAFDDYLSVALVDFGVEGLDVIDAVGIDVDGVVDVECVVDIDGVCQSQRVNNVERVVNVYVSCVMDIVVEYSCVMNVVVDNVRVM